MKKNQKKGLAISMIATTLVTSFALYAWQKEKTHKFEWTKVESGKPDSIMVSTIKGDTSLVEDTMKLLRSEHGEAIVPVDDTSKSDIILIKR